MVMPRLDTATLPTGAVVPGGRPRIFDALAFAALAPLLLWWSLLACLALGSRLVPTRRAAI